jgi:hypothetical protein
VRFLVVAAFRAAVVRFLVLAAFFPAATRFGDFLEVVREAVRFRAAVVRFRAAVVRFLVVAAFRAAVVRFLVVAAFRAAVFRVRVVEAFRAAVLRFRVVAAFFPAATRFGDFLVVVRAAVRFRVVAAFRAAVRFLVAGFRAAVGVVLVRVVAGRVIASSIGPAMPVGMPSDRGPGRSHAGVSGRHEGCGALGASWEPPSSTSLASSVLSDARSSSQGRSGVVRSSDDAIAASSARGSPEPVPDADPDDASTDARQKGFRAVKSSHPRSDRYWYSRQLAIRSSRTRITTTP